MSREPEQLSLGLQRWWCPSCHGTGHRHDPETGNEMLCRVCEGAGTVDYDPDDREQIPY